VASLNTALGFAIAVHLGRRYRAMADTETDWDFGDELAWSGTPEKASSSEPTTDAAEAPPGALSEPVVEPEEEADDSTIPASEAEMESPAEMESSAGSERNEPAGEWTTEAVGPSMPALTGETELTSEPESALAALGELEDAVGEPPASTPGGMPESQSEPDIAGATGRPEDDSSKPAGRPPTAADDDDSRSESRRAPERDDGTSEPSNRDLGMQGSEQDTLEAASRAGGEVIELQGAATGATALPGGEVNAETGRTLAAGSAEVGTEPPMAQDAAGTEESVASGKESRPAAPDSAGPDVLAKKAAQPTAGEEAIEAFLAEVEQYQGHLDLADGALRSQVENPDGDSIRACLQSLLEASRDYAERREHARERLEAVRGERPEFGMVCEKLDGACVRQDKQIESTERAITAFPYTDDLTRGCRVMIDETAKLVDANILVRDTLHEVGVTLARGENRLADLSARKQSDASTGVEGRDVLESTLLQWIDEGTGRAEMLTVAAIDVDEFSQVNREFGHTVGNQLLHALEQLFVAENRGQARLTRFSGERFVLLFPNANLRKTTNAVERLRQIVETACFDYKKAEIRITVSCGVAEAVAGDTSETILARAEATLMEAKRYGRNRTFIHEGKYPTPVVPPKFSIEQRRMTL
jgi:diguanylate cyclase (GGDEF)-like protein